MILGLPSRLDSTVHVALVAWQLSSTMTVALQALRHSEMESNPCELPDCTSAHERRLYTGITHITNHD